MSDKSIVRLNISVTCNYESFYARLYMISALANPCRKIAIEVDVRPSRVNERTQDDDEGMLTRIAICREVGWVKGLKFSIQQLHRSDLH